MINQPAITKHGVHYWTGSILNPSCPECNTINVTSNILEISNENDLECKCNSCNCVFTYINLNKKES